MLHNTNTSKFGDLHFSNQLNTTIKTYAIITMSCFSKIVNSTAANSLKIVISKVKQYYQMRIQQLTSYFH